MFKEKSLQSSVLGLAASAQKTHDTRLRTDNERRGWDGKVDTPFGHMTLPDTSAQLRKVKAGAEVGN